MSSSADTRTATAATGGLPLPLAAPAGPRLAVLVAILLCSYAVALETTVVSAAIPTVIAGFGGLSDLSWVFSAYLIAQAVTMPLFGSASDRGGRKRSYLFAAALFFVGTFACGLAGSMAELVAFRVVQGIGAGGLITVGTAALNDMIPHDSRGKYQAMGNAVWGLAAVSGPLVGSAIMQTFDWRWIFWINLPVVVLSAALLAMFYAGRGHASPAPDDASEGPLAVMPSVYLCGALLALMVVLVHGQQLSAPLWALCVAVGGVATWRLVAVQRRSGPDALFPAGLLRVRMVGLAAASSFLCGAIAMGLTVYLPSFAALILRADYLAISATVGVMTLTWTFSGIAVGVVIKSRRFRLMAGIAAALVLAGSLALCFFAIYLDGVLALLVISGLLGVGLGACSVIFSVALQCAVPDAVRGSATSLFYLARMQGQSIGVALCGGVLASSDPQARALMQQLASGHGDEAAGRALAQAAAMTGAVRSEFVVVFGLIAALAALQCLLSFRTPVHAPDAATH